MPTRVPSTSSCACTVVFPPEVFTGACKRARYRRPATAENVTVTPAASAMVFADWVATPEVTATPAM